MADGTPRADRPPRSTSANELAKTSTFAMSRTIFASVPTSGRTLKPLQRKENRRPAFEIMESSTQQSGRAQMMQTKWADRAGTTDYVLSAWCRIPLDDPNGIGNFGLDGYDEEAIGRYYASEAAAKRATSALLAAAQTEFPGCTVDYVAITQREWDEELIEDREYGQIRSAAHRNVRRRTGYPTDDGKVEWKGWTNVGLDY